jgi:hypothetical protein
MDCPIDKESGILHDRHSVTTKSPFAEWRFFYVQRKVHFEPCFIYNPKNKIKGGFHQWNFSTAQ